MRITAKSNLRMIENLEKEIEENQWIVNYGYYFVGGFIGMIICFVIVVMAISRVCQ